MRHCCMWCVIVVWYVIIVWCVIIVWRVIGMARVRFIGIAERVLEIEGNWWGALCLLYREGE